MAGEPHLPGFGGVGWCAPGQSPFHTCRNSRCFLKQHLPSPAVLGVVGSRVVRGQGWGLEPEAEFTFQPWGGGLTSLCLCSSCVNGTKAVPAHGAVEAQLSWFS